MSTSDSSLAHKPLQEGTLKAAEGLDSAAEQLELNYLRREELIATVRPTDAQLALCCLYANRYYTQKRLARAAAKLGHEQVLTVHDQFVDRRVGVRMVTFVTPIQHLANGGQVAGAAFVFRGTRLNKTGTVRADYQLIQDRNAELLITQRAMKHMTKHMRRLQLLHPAVQWGFFTAGHSLGGFTAISSAILCDAILECVAFESPGLTTFYHKLAGEKGDDAYWQARVVNYLAIPNPINMCQRHLGRIHRVHFPRIECGLDMLHIFKCLLGTCVRILNWLMALSLGLSMLRLLTGFTLSALACSQLLSLTSPRLAFLLAGDCAMEVAVQPVALATSAFWTLKSAAAFVAARLGTTVRFILQQHSMWHMTQAFDPSTGLPHKSVEMLSWPKVTRMSGGFFELLGKALLECVWATGTSEGISVLLDRNAMIEARIAKLPGYVEMQDEIDSSDWGWLRQLGDVFELWSEDEERQELQPRLSASRPSAASVVGISPVASMNLEHVSSSWQQPAEQLADLFSDDSHADGATSAADESEAEVIWPSFVPGSSPDAEVPQPVASPFARQESDRTSGSQGRLMSTVDEDAIADTDSDVDDSQQS